MSDQSSNEARKISSDTQPQNSTKRQQEKQDEMHRLYLEQQRKMRCVGCGEVEETFELSHCYHPAGIA